MALRDGKGGFDLHAYRQATRLMTLALEISLSMARTPSKTMAERVFHYRPIALGYANLGGLLMSLGISYESEQGRQLAGGLASLLTAEAALASAGIAGVAKILLQMKL